MLKELENTSRIVRNIQNLIAECDIKGQMAVAVAEATTFLDAFQKNICEGIENARFEAKRQAEDKQDTPKTIDNQVGV